MNGYTVTSGYRSSARRLTVSLASPNRYDDDQSAKLTVTVTDESDNEDKAEAVTFTVPLAEFSALVKFWTDGRWDNLYTR